MPRLSGPSNLAVIALPTKPDSATAAPETKPGIMVLRAKLGGIGVSPGTRWWRDPAC